MSFGIRDRCGRSLARTTTNFGEWTAPGVGIAMARASWVCVRRQTAAAGGRTATGSAARRHDHHYDIQLGPAVRSRPGARSAGLLGVATGQHAGISRAAAVRADTGLVWSRKRAHIPWNVRA